MIIAHSKCLVRKNRFTHSTLHASVVIEKTSRVRIIKNIIENNVKSGLELRDPKTKVSLSQTIIRNNAEHGLFIHDGAVCEVEQNNIHSNKVEPQISIRGKHARIRDRAEISQVHHSTSFTNEFEEFV